MNFKSVTTFAPEWLSPSIGKQYRGHERRPPASVMEAIGESCKLVTGRSPLAYHGMYDLSSRKINEWPWWIPKYGPEPKPSLKWLFWQYTQQGRMTGIRAPVDRSMFWGTDAEFMSGSSATFFLEVYEMWIVLLILLILMFSGGGFYYGGPYRYWGGGFGFIILIVVLLLLFGR
jgi:hypothetical protein